LSKRDRIQLVQNVSVIAVDHLEDLINGNFKRPKSPLMVARTRIKPKPVIDPSPPGTVALPDNLIMVNPTVVYRPSDKKYLMYFKGNLYDPAGPFHPLNDVMFSLRTPDGKLASAEDPYVWYHPGTELFYAVFKDFQGHFTGAAPGLAVMISPDGIHWEMHPERVFAPRDLPYRHVTNEFEKEWVNRLKAQYLAHQIFKSGGLIRKMLPHAGLKKLSPTEMDFLEQHARQPWRFCFSIILENPSRITIRLLTSPKRRG
jgi:hypothetical protein